MGVLQDVVIFWLVAALVCAVIAVWAGRQ